MLPHPHVHGVYHENNIWNSLLHHTIGIHLTSDGKVNKISTDGNISCQTFSCNPEPLHDRKVCVNRGFVWVASISSVNVNLTDIKVPISMKLSMHIMPLDILCINFGAFNFLHEEYKHDCHTDL